MINDRKNGAWVRIPEQVLERYRVRNLRLLPQPSEGAAVLSAEIVNEARKDGEPAGYINLVLDVAELCSVLDRTLADVRREVDGCIDQ